MKRILLSAVENSPAGAEPQEEMRGLGGDSDAAAAYDRLMVKLSSKRIVGSISRAELNVRRNGEQTGEHQRCEIVSRPFNPKTVFSTTEGTENTEKEKEDKKIPLNFS